MSSTLEASNAITVPGAKATPTLLGSLPTPAEAKTNLGDWSALTPNMPKSQPAGNFPASQAQLAQALGTNNPLLSRLGGAR